tara:strand:- start:123 stop:1229 length:1107 start_codon:yes stop_codon:yes gene_type:complete
MEKSQKRLILFMPSMDGGGVEKNLIIIGNYLSKVIDSIILITFDDKFNKFFSNKIKIINVQKKNKKKVSKYYKYLRCLLILTKEILKNRNSSVFSFQANIYSIILSKIINFKLIVRSNSSPSGWTKSFLKNYLFKKFFKYPASIIVNSISFKNEIDKKFNIDSTLIYNPLNKNEILKKSKEKINIPIYRNKKNLKIINIGRFTDQKDHQTLLRSFKKLNQNIGCELLLIGYGANKAIIQKFIIENKLKNKVKILGYQVNPYKFIKKSDILVLTSKYEGLPNVLLEALALKKLVISTNCPTGPNEILKKGKYGFLFKVQNYNELTKIILKYSNNKKKYRNKILSGYKSLNRFDLDTNCKKYYNEIKKIL